VETKLLGLSDSDVLTNISFHTEQHSIESGTEYGGTTGPES
jgi:hypothetical protein